MKKFMRYSLAMNKLKEQSGETLVETLFAIVIIVLALTFFPTAIMTASNLARYSEEATGTCPIIRSDENRLPSAHLAFRTATSAGDGKWDVSSANMVWGVDNASSTYTVAYSSTGNDLVRKGVPAVTEETIAVSCYMNQAEGGTNTPNYYFYDVVAVN